MPYVFLSPTHSCMLETHRCEATTAYGQCRRRVTIGLPLCWQHSQQVYGVRMAPSTIAGAGRGLFATRDFQRGEVVCPYGGRLLTAGEVEQLYPGDTLAPYVERLSGKAARDAACVRGIGSMANGMPRREDSNAETFVRRNRVPWLRAIRRIRQGEEIFNHYGAEYFEDANVQTSTTKYVRSSGSRRSRRDHSS